MMLRLPANRTGRDLFVGDVHGHADRLYTLLDAAGFDRGRDRLFSVGDLVDRGPASAELLLAQADADWFHAVMGNHEAMLANGGRDPAVRARWRDNGGQWFDAVDAATQARLVERAAALPLTIEIAQPDADPIGVVHADPPDDRAWPTLATAAFSAERDALPDTPSVCGALLWSRAGARRARGGEVLRVPELSLLLSGHTPMRDWAWTGNRLFLDTGGYLDGGALTLAEPAAARCWQLGGAGVIERALLPQR